MYREGRHKRNLVYTETKTATGYRVTLTQKGCRKFDENGLFIVRRVRGTDDYYVF